MRNLVFIGVMLFTVVSNAQRLTESSSIPQNSVIYSLPLTEIEVSVEIEEEQYMPGPYVSFSEFYLSIQDVMVHKSLKYRIANVSMRPIFVADYENMYYFPIGAKNVRADFFSLTSEGIIYSNENLPIQTDTPESIDPNEIFKDRLPSSPMITKKLSSYERIKTDSGFIHVPYQQSIINEKDPERKAEEAAKFIYALRQRRFELITGDVDNAFSGNSLKDALREINRLEEEYVSLFLGKTFVKKHKYVFRVTPSDSNDKRSYNVFRFSESRGVIPVGNKEGRSITMDVTPEGRLNSVQKVIAEQAKGNALYYRVPETANIQLMDAGVEICSGFMKIYQMGKTFSVPADVSFK